MRITTEYRQQPHNHQSVALGGQFGGAAMGLQPPQILLHTRIDRIGNWRGQRRDDASISEECDEPPRAPHIPARESFAASIAAASAHVLGEATENIEANVAQSDIASSQPCGEMACDIGI